MWATARDLFDERTNTWKSGLQLPEVLDAMLKSLFDRDEAVRVANLPDGATEKSKQVKEWNKTRAEPKWWPCFLRSWWPRFGIVPAPWCIDNTRRAATAGAAAPTPRIESRQQGRDVEKVPNSPKSSPLINQPWTLNPKPCTPNPPPQPQP